MENAASIRKHAAELAAFAPDAILAFGASTVGPLLQETRTVHTVPIVLSRAIGNGSASAMYRIGRFSYFIRYAIAQRMANLFARSGMTEQFETECEVAAGLTLETLIPCAGQTED